MGEPALNKRIYIEDYVETYLTELAQPGDTLAAISKQVYESTEYIEDIAQLNKLTDQNKIYPGQKLQLPPKD